MSEEKTYVFEEHNNIVNVISVKAENYDDAVALLLSGDGDILKTDSEITSYDCIDNPDNSEESDDETVES